MGTMLKASCPKCGYEKNLSVGQGLRFNKLDKVLDLFDKESQAKIKKVTTAYPKLFWSVTKEPASCDLCESITAVAVFTIKDATGKGLRVISKCECGGMANVAYYETLSAKRAMLGCPKCRAALKIDEIGHWD